MKRIYCAGKYSGDNVLSVLQNIGRGEKIAASLFANGYAPFSPWADKDFCFKLPDHDFTVRQFYDYSIAWLEVSEAVFLVPGWEESAGTLKELEIAAGLGLPVFTNFKDLDNFFKAEG